jgi:hypothetical protein
MAKRLLTLLIAALAGAAHAQAPQPRVCPDPAEPCAGFKANDLSFPLPDDGKARAEARSAPFFAVILKTAARCKLEPGQAREAQLLFPRNKVFYTRFECDDDPGNNISYTNSNPKLGFLAVYAGEERAAAQEFLEQVDALGLFPGANLRRMQVVVVYP